ncbi:MAG: NAD(P)H-hydrate epimerase [Dehalococcoidia bacterium]
MAIRSSPGRYPERRASGLPAVTPPVMQDIQRSAQEDFGLDILQLVENGGRATSRVCLGMLGGKGRLQRVLVLAGGGNKGATGLSAARHLTNWGVAVEVVLGEVETEMSFAAQRHIKILSEAGIIQPTAASSENTLEEHLRGADLIIDALVGYGLSGPPLGMAAAVTDLAMAAGRPVLAIDVPTGVNAATGDRSHPSISATTTIMLDLPKAGLLLPHCRVCTGELYLADLGIPRAVYERFGLSIEGLFSEGPIVKVRR